MQNKKPIIPPRETKEYLAKNEVPQLFECLMTGIMYHRPVDPLDYMQECIEKIKRHGFKDIRWDLFLESKRCPLPPLSAKRCTEPFSKYQPLPGIDSLRLKMRPQTSVICIIGAPGVDTNLYAERMLNHYPNFVHLNMGDLAKNCSRIEAKKSKGRFPNAFDLISSGDFAPEAMIFELLIWNLNQYPTCNGFVIDGYPRTQQQYDDFKMHIGLERTAAIILVDAPEEKCLRNLMQRSQINDPNQIINEANAIRRRMCNFKNITLPMCKTVDDNNKLRVIDGDMVDKHIEREMLTILEFVLSGQITGPCKISEPGLIPNVPVNKTMETVVGCIGNPQAFKIPQICPEYKDNGRLPTLPKCPILMLFGGPGSGRSKQAFSLCKAMPCIKHFNITDLLRTKVLDSLSCGGEKDWDIIARRVHGSEPPSEYDRFLPEYWDLQVDILRDEFANMAVGASAVVIEGYMNDENQLNVFNQIIGGADIIALLDCEEATMSQRLNRRGARLRRIEDEGHIISQRINFFKQVTLPVVRYFDEQGKLVIIPADRDPDLITKDLIALMEYYLAKAECDQGNNNATNVLTPVSVFQSHDLSSDEAATIIQTRFREYQKRKQLKLMEPEIAATIIQSSFRGYKARLELMKLMENKFSDFGESQ